MKKSNCFTYLYAVLLSIVSFMLVLFSSMSGITVSAALSSVDGYSDVLEDLEKDENFDRNEFPIVSGDYSLKVIQVAESTTHELMIYVYQPMGVLAKATSIVFSTGVKSELKYQKYVLERVSSSDTLYKYRVKDFTVMSEPLRYYDISEIFRKFDKVVDSLPDGDNTVSEKAYPVGQLWSAVTSGETVIYNYQDVEVVKVTNQMVGMRRYPNGLSWSEKSFCDAHFLAFSTDHEIDRLVSADISFYTAHYRTKNFLGSSTTVVYERVPQFVTLNYDQVTGNEGGGIGGKKYHWDRMSSTADYVEDLKKQGASFDKDEDKNLLKYEWILNFYESDYTCPAGAEYFVWYLITPLGLGGLPGLLESQTYEGELTGDVTLLRLAFETDGKIYNLGVVSDVQTGSDKPINEGSVAFNFLKWLSEKTGLPQWAWILIFVIVAICIALPLLFKFLPDVFYLIVKGVMWLLKGLWWIICFPFKGIAALVHKVKEKRGG